MTNAGKSIINANAKIISSGINATTPIMSKSKHIIYVEAQSSRIIRLLVPLKLSAMYFMYLVGLTPKMT